MEKENENLDSPNETEDTEKVNEEEVADTESEEEEKPEYTENEKKLYARMKKAEADAKLLKTELENLDLSDELKKEVATYAKVQGISVKKALSSDYISFLKEKEEKKEKNNNASLGSNRKGTTKKDYSEKKASEFDLRTPEGRAEHAKYQEYLKEQLG